MVRLSTKAFPFFGSPRDGSARIARRRLLRQVRQAGLPEATSGRRPVYTTGSSASVPASHQASEERHHDLLRTLLTEGYQV
jgi:hypothetical protein